jgi:hypothetical protein
MVKKNKPNIPTEIVITFSKKGIPTKIKSKNCTANQMYSASVYMKKKAVEKNPLLKKFGFLGLILEGFAMVSKKNRNEIGNSTNEGLLVAE